MGLEIFLIGLIVGVFMSSYGYVEIGFGAIILSFIFMLVDYRNSQVRKAPSVRVKGAQMLEPITIEVPKGPPYKIPSYHYFAINPYWGAYPGYEHMTNAISKGFKYLYWNLIGRPKK